jgi:hypothetical protein
MCSWCGVTMQGGSTPDGPVTHSICPKCIAKIDEQIADVQREKQTDKK